MWPNTDSFCAYRLKSAQMHAHSDHKSSMDGHFQTKIPQRPLDFIYIRFGGRRVLSYYRDFYQFFYFISALFEVEPFFDNVNTPGL